MSVFAQHLRRRGAVLSVLIALLLGPVLYVILPAGSSRAASSTPPTARPTIVLEHGAWADASSWDGVIARLQAAGYHVLAPANPLQGLVYDSHYLASVLAQTPGPLVVVGHSYGGAVITNAAAGNARVKALVYIDAFVPDIGETGKQLAGHSAVLKALMPLKYPPYGPTDVDLYINPAKFRSVFAADVPAKETAILAATQRPLALSAFTQKTYAAAWKHIPSWDLIGLDDRVIPPSEQLFMARRAHATIEKIHSSHLSPVSHPGAVAAIIEQAARATS